jgi:hypothetical protein
VTDHRKGILLFVKKFHFNPGEDGPLVELQRVADRNGSVALTCLAHAVCGERRGGQRRDQPPCSYGDHRQSFGAGMKAANHPAFNLKR